MSSQRQRRGQRYDIDAVTYSIISHNTEGRFVVPDEVMKILGITDNHVVVDVTLPSGEQRTFEVNRKSGPEVYGRDMSGQAIKDFVQGRHVPLKITARRPHDPEAE